MKSPAFRLLLFGISITAAAALAQVDSLITTYTHYITSCQSSFCDAFFKDYQIFSVTGEGKASMQETDEDGCGITIMDDSEVTCSMPCNNQEGKERNKGNDYDNISFAVLLIGFTFLLAVFALFLTMLAYRQDRKR
jgi:hypothetical protein